MTTPVIGFIGLGAMGLPLASSLVRKGFNVAGYDINTQQLDKLVQLGARKGSSAKDVVQDADIVITVLPATQHVDAVVLGPNGLLAHMAKGSLLMEMSTIDPTCTDRVAAACQAKGIAFVDAPIGRLVSHAERGESLFMVGGGDEAFARVEPLLNAMGTSIHRCGEAGMGIRMKLVNNNMLLVTAQVVSESLTLGAKMGLDMDIMKAVCSSTTAQNKQLDVALSTKVLQGDIEPGFTIDLAHKDIGLAVNAANAARIGMPASTAAYATLSAARGTRYASKDYSALLLYALDQAGIELTPSTSN